MARKVSSEAGSGFKGLAVMSVAVGQSSGSLALNFSRALDEYHSMQRRQEAFRQNHHRIEALYHTTTKTGMKKEVLVPPC